MYSIHNCYLFSFPFKKEAILDIHENVDTVQRIHQSFDWLHFLPVTQVINFLEGVVAAH